MSSYRQIRPIWSEGLDLLLVAQSQVHVSDMTAPIIDTFGPAISTSHPPQPIHLPPTSKPIHPEVSSLPPLPPILLRPPTRRKHEYLRCNEAVTSQ
eukprot:scaffold22541_cov42-Cyclotella_meneghiniana.AAC.5